MPVDQATKLQSLDPLAEQAVTLLAKAMVTSHEREQLWEQFRHHVDATTVELEEAPIREALDELERRGLSLNILARVVHERLADG
jgi:TPP-dependent pyruvate/acetoin dehydrogenase alpha subunit